MKNKYSIRSLILEELLKFKHCSIMLFFILGTNYLISQNLMEVEGNIGLMNNVGLIKFHKDGANLTTLGFDGVDLHFQNYTPSSDMHFFTKDDFIFNSDGFIALKFDDATNRIGIGTSTPKKRLDVNGDIALTDNSGRVSFYEGDTEKSRLEYTGTHFELSNFESGGDLKFVTQDEMTFFQNGINLLHLDNNNRVGIGEFFPNTKLHVDTDPGMAGGIHIEGPQGGHDAWLRIENGGGSHHLFDDFTDSNALDLESANDLVFNTGGPFEQMRINEFGTITMGGPASGPEIIIFDGANPSIEPYTNDDASLGAPLFRWKEIWSINPFNTASDLRLKKDIESLNYGIEEVMALNPVSYKWKEGSERKMLGFIAQDLEQIIPEVVSNTHLSDLDPVTLEGRGSETMEDMYGVYYTEIIPVVIKAMQEQQNLIIQLQEKNNHLEEVIVSLESRIQSLE